MLVFLLLISFNLTIILMILYMHIYWLQLTSFLRRILLCIMYYFRFIQVFLV